MIPHGKVEEELEKQLVQGEEDDVKRVCVTAVPDAKKGEKLVVLQLESEKTADELRKGLSDAGLPNLFIPAADSFYIVDEIPMLGTGKLDLGGAKQKSIGTDRSC